MDEARRLAYLRVALRVFGIFLVVGVYPLMNWLWPAGWAWEPRQSEYEQMITGIYATLGVFLFRAARDPLANLSLIRFTIWSSLVHGGIMAVQAGHDHTEHANLFGDIPALFAMAAVLWWLLPRRASAP
ncbi:MAG: hypothetical protein H6977_12975 [Gammaproteobacteria bacterium]|nr:hypothetical protein [Gammaproteobacteria bacterium]MCP5200920.1 hypothetical protein [Gammaproteobacteria bacterium]